MNAPISQEDQSLFTTHAANAPAATSKVTVYHDGGCPLCRAEVALMRKLDSTSKVEWVDIISQQPIPEREGFSYRDAMEKIHVRQADGSIQTGVEGFLAVWRLLPGYRRVVPIVVRTPGLLALLKGLYRGFAKVRLRVYRQRITLAEK